MPLAGTLSLYDLPGADDDDPPVPTALPYFTSGELASDKALVFIGGLTNGIGSVEYIPALSETLGKLGWRL
jgi:hypothetical protein